MAIDLSGLAREQLLDSILGSATEFAIIATDADGIVVEWHGGAERILGWPAEEAAGRHLRLIFIEGDRRDGVPEAEMRTARDAGRADDERWHLRRDGSRFFASGYVMPLRADGTGAPIGYLKILRDRTEEARRQDRLRQSEERLSLALDAGAIGVWDWHPAGDRIVADARFADLHGVDPQEADRGVPADRFLRAVHPDDLAGLRDALGGAAAGIGLLHEYRATRPEGSPRWLQARGRLAEGAGGAARVVGTVVDVTERKRAELCARALVALGDRLRQETDVAAIALAAARHMADALGAVRAGFGTVDPLAETVSIKPDWCAPGIASVSGDHRFRDYGSYIDDLKRGDTVLIPDVATDPRTAASAETLLGLGIRVLVNVPILEAERFVAVAFVHFDRPHDWTEDELSFVRAVADRAQAAVARAQAEERRRLMSGEIAHRLKNDLTIVNAIVSQSLRAAPDVSAARATIAQRLGALGRMHDLLVGGGAGGGPLRAVAKAALAPHDDGQGRITLQGPDLDVGGRSATALSLMLHELATNAAKYGALSAAGGEVDLSWHVDDDALELEWRESGGPKVAPPQRTGFGSSLIQHGLGTRQAVEFEWRPEGLVVRGRVGLETLRPRG